MDISAALKRAAWIAAEVVIVMAACALIFWRARGLMCSGFVAIFAGLVFISALKYCIKQQKRKQMVSLILVLLMSAAVSGVVFYETGSNSLFRNYVADPVPGSVRILGSEYQGGLDPAVYLHFEISPDDFEAILRKRPYEIRPDVSEPSVRLPAWWKPQSLKNATVYFYQGVSDESKNWMWVNELKTEVYFAYWNF